LTASFIDRANDCLRRPEVASATVEWFACSCLVVLYTLYKVERSYVNSGSLCLLASVGLALTLSTANFVYADEFRHSVYANEQI